MKHFAGTMRQHVASAMDEMGRLCKKRDAPAAVVAAPIQKVPPSMHQGGRKVEIFVRTLADPQ